MLGARETTRRTGTGMRTLRPVSSRTVRNESFAGGALGVCSARECAKPGATHSNAAATTGRNRLEVKIFKVEQLSRQMFFVIFRKADNNKKCPASPVGQKAHLPLARSS